MSSRATTGPRPPLDVERARRDTPGCAKVIHLNNAGSSLPPAPVTEAVVAHLRREAEVGGYEAAAEAAGAVEGVYRSVATLVNADPAEIALVESATRAWNLAFAAVDPAPGTRILTGRAEYASNVIAFLHLARRRGVRIEVIDDDEHGQTSVRDLERRLASTGRPGSRPGSTAGGVEPGDVALVAITHVPTQGGLVNPVAAIGQVTRAAGVPYLLDACQSVGQLPVDVAEIGCDLLSATGRKFLRAPRGTGFLYARAGLAGLESPFPDLHSASWTARDRYTPRSDARRFEEFERSYANVLGLGVAVDYALGFGLEAISDRVTGLAAGLRRRLADQPGVTVHDQGERRCGIVTFTVGGVPAADVVAALSARGINTSVSLVEYARYDLPERGLPDLVRASVHYYNTEAELAALCAALPGPVGAH